MAETLVIMPTFNHERLLRYSIASVLGQTYTDFELVVIGDGSPPGTADIVDEFDDPRVSYVHHPKSPRTGEPYRDPVIRESDARFVTYAGDDDLWLPHHLATITPLLESADFAHTQPTEVTRAGKLYSWMIDLEDPKDRAMLVNYENRLPPSVIGHTRELYLSLPEGWATAPDGIPTDVYMWSKIFQAPDLVAVGVRETTSFKFVQAIRNDMTLAERDIELAEWLPRVQDPAWLEQNVPPMLIAGYFHSWHDTDILYREARQRADDAEAALTEMTAERDGAASAVEWMSESPFWKLRSIILKVPGVAWLARNLRGNR